MSWLVIEEHTDTILATCPTRAGAARSVTRRFNAASRAGILNDGEGFCYVEEEYYYRMKPWKKLGISYQNWYDWHASVGATVTSQTGV